MPWQTRVTEREAELAEARDALQSAQRERASARYQETLPSRVSACDLQSEAAACLRLTHRMASCLSFPAQSTGGQPMLYRAHSA